MRGPSDLLAYRDEFPAVARTVFLGSHTLGPLSRGVRGAVERFLDLWENKPSAERIWFEDIIPEMRRLEALYARLVGADKEEVTLMPSVSTGLSSLASCVDFEEASRCEVVLARDEFPTDCHVWLAQVRRGARVRWVEPRADAREEAYVEAVGPDTAVVNASRVSYLDGAVLDPGPLAAACRHAGALLVLDDYHGSGVVPLDAHEVGCEALVGGPLKYLLGGPGVAFLYVRRDLAPTLEPTVTGWFSQADFFAFDNERLDWPDDAGRFALGTPAPAAVFAAAAGLDLVLEIGVERMRERVHDLVAYGIAAADERGYAVRTPRAPTRRAGMFAIDVEDAERTLGALLDRDVVVDGRHGGLRICPHFFNSEDDLDAFFDALDDLQPPRAKPPR